MPTLCMKSFYSTDYCPLETEQIPRSKPHLRPQASVKPKGDSSPIKSSLPFPACNIYFLCHSKFISAKAPRQPGLSHTGRCEPSAVGKVKIFLDRNSLRNVLRKENDSTMLSRPKLSILCLISNVLPRLKL